MADSKFHIIIVDDTMGEKDPFVVNLKLDYADDAEVSYFENVESAMAFVEDHMSERMIIFMNMVGRFIMRPLWKMHGLWMNVVRVLRVRN